MDCRPSGDVFAYRARWERVCWSKDRSGLVSEDLKENDDVEGELDNPAHEELEGLSVHNEPDGLEAIT